jgi:hypothetical protein
MANPASFMGDALVKEGFKPRRLLGLRATFLEATLQGKDSVVDDSGCTYVISLVQPGHDSRGVRTLGRAVMAMDCNKTEGDSVYCVHIGRAFLDTGRTKAWLLVVVPSMGGIYRRIGTAIVDQQNYACTASSLQDILLA